MKRWKEILFANKYFLLSLLFFSLTLTGHLLTRRETLDFLTFQKKFTQQEKALITYSSQKINDISNGDSTLNQEAFSTYVYKNDSLILWNSNQLPVENHASKFFPCNGLLQLKNGWYYFYTTKKKDLKLCSGFLVKRNYSYENTFLQNDGTPNLSNAEYSIEDKKGKGQKIYNLKGQLSFLIRDGTQETPTENKSLIMLFLLFGLTTFLFGLYEKFKSKRVSSMLLFISLLMIRWLFFQLNYEYIFGEQEFLSSEFFAYNLWSPNLLDFSINIIFSAILILLLFRQSEYLNSKISFWLKIPGLLIIWWFVLKIIELLVLNSMIQLNLEELFSIDLNTVLVLFLVGFIFYFYQKLVRIVIREAYTKKINLIVFTIITFLCSILFIFYRIKNNEDILLSSFFPVFIIFISLWYYKQKTNRQTLLCQILVLGLSSLIFISDLNHFNGAKDLETRKLYAHQLAIEQDLNLELDYSELKASLIQSSKIILEQIDTNKVNSTSEFGNFMENKFFNGSWDAYEISCDLYNRNKQSIISKESHPQSYWEDIIVKHGDVSQINNELFLIQNEWNGYTYVIRQVLSSNDSITLIVGLKSKRIPEEIGLPRLLISDKTKVFASLEKYSIAKYSNETLIKNYGRFDFPRVFHSLRKENNKEASFNLNGYNHYYYSTDTSKSIVISKKNKTWLEFITSFSSIFCFWGISVILINLVFRVSIFDIRGKDLSFKIQLVFILLIVLTLVLFVIGSGIFVRKQYQDLTEQAIKEKLHSIEEEIKGKVSGSDKLSENTDRSFLDGFLNKLSNVFKTDLNIYDKKGYLISTSRPKIFTAGLLSEQINPIAFSDLKRNRTSYFSHLEQIGLLSYISSYMPLYNEKRELLGYVNLQYFSKQNDLEIQIQEFIMEIVNVFILLIGVSIIFSLIISNWLTSPLRILKKKVDSLKIASENKQIDYAGSDEIGLIVQAYNQKIGELQEASIQLAKNERESAWREMAKQVAHEIKNPLTPMKLSIQHLLRTYDPKDPDSKIRIETLLSSLIEQIDGLTRIANEFSNFAQMPGPIKVETDLIAIIKNAIALFESEVAIKIVLKTNLEAAILNIDKDQWGQALNNLIKNSLQALIEVEEAGIIISLEDKPEENAYVIKVKDNGRGIKKEDLSKVFTPYFTTKSTGTGIGLFLVKQIVENHNGTISFETKENKGTTFSLVIPKTGN